MSFDDRLQTHIDNLIKSRTELQGKIRVIDEIIENLNDIKTVVVHPEQTKLVGDFDKDGNIKTDENGNSVTKIEKIPKETKPPKNRYSGKEFTDEEREKILERIEKDIIKVES